VAISLKAFNVLHYLVTHPDCLLTKDMLLDTLWAEMAVSDAVARVAIRELCKPLGDTVQTPQYIATVHQVI
jgi:DNA-binding winged helix-turn-helix (wHTH) protein